MSRTVNRVELLGRVGADPEMRYSQAGPPSPPCGWPPTAAARTATRRPTGTPSSAGASRPRPWPQYVKKGNRLFVAGSLAQNTFETEDGQRRHRTEVHAQEVVFLDSNGNGNGTPRSASRSRAPESVCRSRRPPRPRPSSPVQPPPPHAGASRGRFLPGRRPRLRIRPTNNRRRMRHVRRDHARKTPLREQAHPGDDPARGSRPLQRPLHLRPLVLPDRRLDRPRDEVGLALHRRVRMARRPPPHPARR